jgi:glucose-1-phosphate adenylyltransferase
MLVDAGSAAVYDFDDNDVPGTTERDRGYWRDVGTLDAYYDSHMDLVSVHPVFNLYNYAWPIRTAMPPLPPAKFVNNGTAVESIVGPGTIISGSVVRDSVISSDVTIEDGASVEGCVLLPGVRVGKGAVVRRAILDKNVMVADGAQLGVHLDADRERYTVSAGGVVVLGKGVRAQ